MRHLVILFIYLLMCVCVFLCVCSHVYTCIPGCMHTCDDQRAPWVSFFIHWSQFLLLSLFLPSFLGRGSFTGQRSVRLGWLSSRPPTSSRLPCLALGVQAESLWPEFLFWYEGWRLISGPDAGKASVLWMPPHPAPGNCKNKTGARRTSERRKQTALRRKH